MDAFLSQLLTLVLVFGYPVVAVTAVVSTAGVPLPMTAILLAAGSLAAVESLNLPVLFVVVTGCSVLGDSLDFYLGRKVGEALIGRLRRRSGRRSAWIALVERSFARWSGTSIFLTRWILTPFSSLVSGLAGFSNYPFRRFLVFDVAGEVVSSAVYLGLGYLLGANWRDVVSDLDSLPGIVVLGTLGLVLVVAGLRWLIRASSPTGIPTRRGSA